MIYLAGVAEGSSHHRLTDRVDRLLGSCTEIRGHLQRDAGLSGSVSSMAISCCGTSCSPSDYPCTPLDVAAGAAEYAGTSTVGSLSNLDGTSSSAISAAGMVHSVGGFDAAAKDPRLSNDHVAVWRKER